MPFVWVIVGTIDITRIVDCTLLFYPRFMVLFPWQQMRNNHSVVVIVYVSGVVNVFDGVDSV